MSLLEVEGDQIRVVFENDNSHLAPEISTFARQVWWREEHAGQREVNFWFRALDMENERERLLYSESRREAWLTIHGTMDHYHGDAFLHDAEHQLVFCAMDGDTPAGVLQLNAAFRAEEKTGMIAFYYMTPEYRTRDWGFNCLDRRYLFSGPWGERSFCCAVPRKTPSPSIFIKNTASIRSGTCRTRKCPWSIWKNTSAIEVPYEHTVFTRFKAGYGERGWDTYDFC